jgi:hypothetical protein
LRQVIHFVSVRRFGDPQLHSALKADLHTRLAEAERCGYGFTLPTQKLEVVPNVPKKVLVVVSRKQPQEDIMSVG